ncbi:uncharacterized protein LOC128869428 isoform X2 [Anastrepha ludens]|uniref:uncharacterized protein LOC128869428 isoform X2 n=1 Tax=Anastrepha ludens TaxID=28586 RepID=UPI0023B14E54|nr:uncharacterized protein LOC128869428 isoform X2 [Anastrepha ludens]
MENNILESAEKDGLESILDSWGFSYILQTLKDESIILERLRYLEEQDLTYLFRERRLGEKVEFRFKLQQWKIANGYSDVKACDTISVDTTFLEDVENSQYLNCSQSTSSSSKVIYDPNGYRGSIIQIDFRYLHPHSTSIFDKWKTFNLKIIPLIKTMLTDPAHLHQLETIKSREKANTARKIYRSTIKDSQMSFILHVVTANDVENCLNKLKTSLYDRGETLQPIIIAVGYNLCDANVLFLYKGIRERLLNNYNLVIKLKTCD